METAKKTASWFWLSIEIVVLLWIAFGIYLFAKWYFFPSKQVEKIAAKTTSVSAKPKKEIWVFEFKTEPEDVINAKKNNVDQICYRENDVINKPYFDGKEIRFKYKTSKGKVIYAILDKKSPSETHFVGMVDLPELPKGRKLIIRLKETSAPDKFEGLIETWDGENWYPQIPAFLKKIQVQ